MKPTVVRNGLGREVASRLFYGRDVREGLRLLPEASIHTVCTSPPYWGLRDYGIGKWEGGDTDCDHTVPNETSLRTSTLQGGKTNVGHALEGFKETCPRCGAVRQDPTSWGGDPDCAHVWGEEGESSQRNRNKKGASTLREDGNGEGEDWTEETAVLHPSTGSFCIHCGAWKGQLGLEPTPELYVEHLVEVFREVARVLRPDGTLWLNLGDTYSVGNLSGALGSNSQVRAPGLRATQLPPRHVPEGMKPKDMVGIPWTVALALRADGWYLRSDIIWAKSNCMPSSVRDRFTTCHEYVFLLAHPKSKGRYFFDQDAVREQHQKKDWDQACSTWRQGAAKRVNMPESRYKTGDGLAVPFANDANPTGRNRRTVWNVNSKPYPGAHFACWPEELVEPMIKAGSSEHGCCSACGAPWERVVEKGPGRVDRPNHSYHPGRPDGMSLRGGRLVAGAILSTGWTPTCECNADVVPCTVLDPFSGSATTGAVAMRLGRNYVGTDVQDKYLPLAVARLEGRAAPKEDTESNPIDELFG